MALPSLVQQPIVKHTLAMSVSQGTISGPQIFRASFGILSSPSTILFKRWLIVLAISLVNILLLTLRQVTGISPVILLRSTGARQGKNLSIRIFTFLLLLLIASNSLILYISGRYRSSTRYPAFFLFLYLFCYRLKAFIIGEAQVSSILINKLSLAIPYFFFQGILQLVFYIFILSLIFRIMAIYIFPFYSPLASHKVYTLYRLYISRIGAQF